MGWEKYLKQLIIKITTEHPAACKNDKLLTLLVWQYQGAGITKELIERLLNPKFFKPETISRLRRSIMPQSAKKENSLF